tara:strand:+ start:1131 stop:2138 length:1008 start_codon:yes stop_codon:yes gene_type:complete
MPKKKISKSKRGSTRKPKYKRTIGKKPDTSIGDAEFYADVSRFMGPIGELGFAPKRTIVINEDDTAGYYAGRFNPSIKRGGIDPEVKTNLYGDDHPRELIELQQRTRHKPYLGKEGDVVEMVLFDSPDSPAEQSAIYAHEYTHRGLQQLLDAKDQSGYSYIPAKAKVLEILSLLGKGKALEEEEVVLPEKWWEEDTPIELKHIKKRIPQGPPTFRESRRLEQEEQHRGDERLTRLLDNLSQLRYMKDHNLKKPLLRLHGTPDARLAGGVDDPLEGGSSEAVIPLKEYDNSARISTLLQQLEEIASEKMQLQKNKKLNQGGSVVERNPYNYTAKAI